MTIAKSQDTLLTYKNLLLSHVCNKKLELEITKTNQCHLKEHKYNAICSYKSHKMSIESMFRKLQNTDRNVRMTMKGEVLFSHGWEDSVLLTFQFFPISSKE